jgi:hypothetical protein
VIGVTGGVCNPAATQLIVDTTAPTIRLTVSSPRRYGHSQARITLRWSASDRTPGSGVAAYAVSVVPAGGGRAVWSRGATSVGATVLTGPRSGLYVLTVTARDRSGNRSQPATLQVRLPS